VLVLRDHVEWLTSLYRIAQLRGETADFMEFSECAMPQGAGFRPVLELLAQAGSPLVADLAGVNGLPSRIAAFLGIADVGHALPQRRNAAPWPIVAVLHQHVARRRARLSLEGAPELQRLLVRLSSPGGARDRAAVDEAAVLLAQQVLRPRIARPFLTLPHARALLARSLADARAPLASAAEIAMLRQRFAADRQWLAETWHVLEETDP